MKIRIAIFSLFEFLSTVVAERPNIILILVDDMGFSDLGCYGGEIQTPTLDRLGRDGIRFTGFRNEAKCFPSRASLLTGLYSLQTDSNTTIAPMKHAVTLGRVLKDAGYSTFFVGKHHSTTRPFDRGFDRSWGLRDGACNHFNPGLRRDGEPEPARKGSVREWMDDRDVFDTRDPAKQDTFPPGFYSTDAFTDRAIQFLQHDLEEGRPFFLYLGYTAPHDPLMAWPDDIAEYDGVYTTGYETIRQERYNKMIVEGLFDPANTPLSPPTHPAWNSLSAAERAEEARRMQVYAAMIHRMDNRIGVLLAELDSLGLTENTLILFASDNGSSSEDQNHGDLNAVIGGLERYASLRAPWANVSNTPFRYFKEDSYEGGILTPFIAYWPRGIINPGRIESRPAHFVDVMPTLLELSGATYPRQTPSGEAVIPLESESFRGVLKDQALPGRAAMFFQWSNGRAVIDGDWKLVSRNGTWALYDLSTDRTETTDVSVTNPSVFTTLRNRYTEWFSRVDQEAPQAFPDSGSVSPGGDVLLEVLANDVDAENALDLASVEILTGPFHGTATVEADGRIRYTHDDSLAALDVLTYRVRDQAGAWSNVAAVQLRVVGGSEQTLEAETAQLLGDCVVRTVQPGYSGSGYVDVVKNTDDAIRWSFSIFEPGDYELIFRYALGSGERPMELQVDGQVQTDPQAFAATGGWERWAETESRSISLAAGSHTIQLRADGSSGPNVDALILRFVVDEDGDGMPSWWEEKAGLDDGNPDDALEHADTDGVDNLTEYRQGTDPTDPESVLRLELSRSPLGLPLLIWNARPGMEYALEATTDLTDDLAWQFVLDIMAEATSVSIPDTEPSPDIKAYRLAVPLP